MSETTDKNPPIVGDPVELEPGIRSILAPNPSPMTYWGTNTYLLGQQDITVLDPGPMEERHLDAIIDALRPGQRIVQIVVTHSHKDHSPLSTPLKAKTNAPIIAFGDSRSGRSDAMISLSQNGEIGGGEGVDESFAPDHLVADGDVIEIEDQSLRVIHTPGHMGNHVSLGLGDVCFTGDHIMGWASSLVSPPDGDLTDFMASCERLAATEWRRFYAGHGAPITEPNARLQWLIAHRRARESEILAALAKAPANAAELVQAIYHDVDPRLIPAAQRNVLAHLVDLCGRDIVRNRQTFEFNTTFELA